ncbi:MAG: hypothetical protein ACK559_36955, partial [bacterium]
VGRRPVARGVAVHEVELGVAPAPGVAHLHMVRAVDDHVEPLAGDHVRHDLLGGLPRAGAPGEVADRAGVRVVIDDVYVIARVDVDRARVAAVAARVDRRDVESLVHGAVTVVVHAV